MKKKNKLLFLATLSTACLLSLASCQGAQGPKGDQGEPGINGTNGTNGKNGEDGEDGNSVRTGKGVPASTLGKDGDSYIDTETFDFYVKSNGAWSKEGNIKGASGDAGNAGEAGAKGEDGTSIRNGKGAPADTLGNDGDCYIDLSTFDFYVKADGKWSKEGNIKGEKGEQGEKGDKGNSGSSGSKGETGADGATAWSNTILPTDGGYVTVDKGSEVVGKDKYFTFEFHATGANTKVTELRLNNKVAGKVKDKGDNNVSYIENLIAGNESKTFKLTVPVVEGGYVVYAKFGDDSSTPTKYVFIDDQGNDYTTLEGAVNAKASKVTLQETYTSSSNITIAEDQAFTLDLNGNTFTNNGKITVKGTLNIINGTTKGTGSISGSGTIVVGKNDDDGTTRANKNLFGGFSTFSNKGLRTYAENNNSAESFTLGENVKISSTGTTAIQVLSGEVSIKGEVSTSTGKAIEVKGGTVAVSGKVESTSGTAVKVEQSADNTASVTVNGGSVKSDSGTAVEVKAGSVTVESGTVSTVSGTAVTVNATTENEESTSVTVKASASVESTSGTAIKVEGGKATVSGTVSGNLEVVKGETTIDSTAKVSLITVAATEDKGATISVDKSATIDSVASTTDSGKQIVESEKQNFPTNTNIINGVGTSTNPYLISSLKDWKHITELSGKDVYFKQTEDITIDSPLTSFAGYYDGDSKKITYSKDTGKWYYAIEKITAYSEFKNINLEMGKVGVSLLSQINWNTGYSASFDNITFSSTSDLVEVNNNNFGLIVTNCLWSSKNSNVSYSFKNITNNIKHLRNDGTCVGFITGYSATVCEGGSASFTLENCTNNGVISGAGQVGFVYGNTSGYYDNANKGTTTYSISECTNGTNGHFYTSSGGFCAFAPSNSKSKKDLPESLKNANSSFTSGFDVLNVTESDKVAVKQNDDLTFTKAATSNNYKYKLGFVVPTQYLTKDGSDWQDGQSTDKENESYWYAMSSIKYFTDLKELGEGETLDTTSVKSFTALDPVRAQKAGLDVTFSGGEDYKLVKSTDGTQYYIVVNVGKNFYINCKATLRVFIENDSGCIASTYDLK